MYGQIICEDTPDMIGWKGVGGAVLPWNDLGSSAMRALDDNVNKIAQLVLAVKAGDVNATNTYARQLNSPIDFSGHIPPEELAQKIGDLAKLKGRPVVLVGTRPVAAMKALRAAGFTEIVQLRGGMSAWQEAGLPVQKA